MIWFSVDSSGVHVIVHFEDGLSNFDDTDAHFDAHRSITSDIHTRQSAYFGGHRKQSLAHAINNVKWKEEPKRETLSGSGSQTSEPKEAARRF